MGWLAQLNAPTSAVTVLSAMITPAVLISACGLLILSTSSRLARVIDRVRLLPGRFDELEKRRGETPLYDERRAIMVEQMAILSRRATFLQWSLTLCYLGVSTFLATSVGIGIVAVGVTGFAWVNVFTALTGAMMLLLGCVFLILESRLAVRGMRSELGMLGRLTEHHARAGIASARGRAGSNG